MDTITRLAVVDRRLQSIALPSLIRPPVGPDDDPTEDLVYWATKFYVYSSIAHVRTLLSGLLALIQAGNKPSADVICRNIFEWAAHACYVREHLTPSIKGKKWAAAFTLLTKASGANRWLKKHGRKYPEAVPSDEIPTFAGVGDLVNAYDAYQTKEFGNGDAKEAYSFLSEHSHPNGACFLEYREISGAEVRFVSPEAPNSFPNTNRSLLDWMTFHHSLLALAHEDSVREQLVTILTHAVAPSSPGGMNSVPAGIP